MTAWFVQTLIASTLLMLAIAAVRPLLRERVEPKVMYALWSLPALRMVMPPLPLLEADAPSAPAPVAAPSAVSADFPLSTILLGVWLAGATLWFVWHIARYRHFVRVSRADAIGGAVTVEGVRVRRCGMVDGPVAAGIWRREIFVPLDFATRFDAQERRLALVHELMHHRRHDLLANLVGLAVLALHWCNPIAHRAYRLFRADQEMACDADVLRDVGQHHDAAYGRALLKACQGAPAAICCLSEAALLKQRLRGLGTRSSAGGRSIAVPLLSAAALVLVLSAATRNVPEPFSAAPPTVADSRPVALPAVETALTPLRAAVPPQIAADETPRDAAVKAIAPPRAFLDTEAAAYPQQQRRSDPEHDRDRYTSPTEAAAARGHPVNDAAYLAQRRALGLARADTSRFPTEAADQGPPLIDPLPTD
jgi:beta-lactamase regulating signal transducer with metallopeptidase domain